MNVPNIISLIRLLATPLIVWLILSGEWKIAFYSFVAAGVSDAVDGFIAKRFNAQTKLGAYLDPIADKVLLVAIYVAMGASELLPSWLVILVVSRDFLIIGGALLLYTLDYELDIHPIWTSKVNTFVQIGLAGFILADHAFNWEFTGYYLGILSAVTACTTVISGAGYLMSWTRQVTADERS